ncbi:MAG: 2Fe-2S iron-sulfur cluster-binding protein [Streptosporangiaceae bacterium]
MLLTYDGRDYELRPGESVLEAMSRQGVSLPSACRAGSCQACLVRSVRGDPGAEAGRGLKPAWRAAGYFLACVARPAGDLAVAGPGEDTRTPGRLASVGTAGPGVLRVHVRPDRPLRYRAGQHVALGLAGVVRIYSIANLPAEAARDGLELHVRVFRSGMMSGRLARAAPGDPVTLGTPAGDCWYPPAGEDGGGARETGPLLLAGTGTGIAPLLAIARAAVADQYPGPVALLHGAARAEGLYLGRSVPAALARQARAGGTAVSWRTCVLGEGADIADAALAEVRRLGADPGRARACLCGGPGSVRRMRRGLFLAGLPLAAIGADQFVPAGC